MPNNQVIVIHRATRQSPIGSSMLSVRQHYERIASELDLAGVEDVVIDSDIVPSEQWAFQLEKDREAFVKAVEKACNKFLVARDFFQVIGQGDPFSQQAVIHTLQRLGYELICTEARFEPGPSYPAEQTPQQLLKRYDSLYLSLIRLRKQVHNKAKGIQTLEGEGKVVGRKTLSETHKELVAKVGELSQQGRQVSEIVKTISRLGYRNSKGKPYQHTQVGRIIKQL